MRLRRILKLALGFVVGAAACLSFAETGLANGATPPIVNPPIGYPGTSFTVQGSYTQSIGCPPPGQILALDFSFYFDSPGNRIWQKRTTTCTNGTAYTGVSPPYTPPANAGTGAHMVVELVYAPTGQWLDTKTARYTIRPRPAPPASPKPPPPSPIPSPSPTCVTEGPAAGCVPVNCARLTAAFQPDGAPTGIALLLLGAAAASVAVGARARRYATLSALSLLLLAGSSCAPHPVAAQQRSVVGFEATPDCRGYWMVSSTGDVLAFGSAGGYGGTGEVHPRQPIAGMESTPSGEGYWLVAPDGRIFAFGDAMDFGGATGVHLNEPIVAMEDTPSGHGYWLVAADGVTYPFGDASAYPNTGGSHLKQPVVDIEATPTGHGYWLVASDGDVFPFGDATAYGSGADQPVVAIECTPDGAGYWLVGARGGVFMFGDAVGYGSAAGTHLNKPIVGIEETPDGRGYWLFASDGQLFPFGDAAGYGAVSL